MASIISSFLRKLKKQIGLVFGISAFLHDNYIFKKKGKFVSIGRNTQFSEPHSIILHNNISFGPNYLIYGEG